MQGVNWNALAAAPNPGAAFAQSFERGMERNRVQEKEWLQYLGNLAQWADTPEKWDQAVDYFKQSGYPDAEQFRGRFELREGLLARAGIAPPAPSGMEKNVDYLRSIGKGDLADDYIQREVMGAPQRPQIVTSVPGGGVFRIDEAGNAVPLIMPNPGDATPGAPVGPPAEAVARLRQNPSEAAQFDEIFGSGAAQRVLGGQTGSAPSGPFQP